MLEFITPVKVGTCILILVSVVKINVFKVSVSSGCDIDCEIFFDTKKIECKGS